jgi:hypothetical protein
VQQISIELLLSSRSRVLQRCLKPEHLVGLGPFVPLDDVELDLVAFLQTFIAVDLNGRVVDENVWTIVSSDKSEAFGVIEPLDLAFVLRHGIRTSFMQIGSREGILSV